MAYRVAKFLVGAGRPGIFGRSGGGFIAGTSFSGGNLRREEGDLLSGDEITGKKSCPKNTGGYRNFFECPLCEAGAFHPRQGEFYSSNLDDLSLKLSELWYSIYIRSNFVIVF